MKKGTKIGLTIVIVVFLGIVLSIRDYMDVGTGYAVLTLVNIVGLGLIFYIWSLNDKKSLPSDPDGISYNFVIETKKDTIDDRNQGDVFIPFEEHLLSELRSCCSPRNFMNPYNHEKVKVANELYSLLQRDSLSFAELLSIRERTIEELGVSVNLSAFYDTLLSCCNPVLFMNPYDAVKVGIANNLYAKLLDSKDDIVSLEAIQKEAIANGIIPVSEQARASHKEGVGTLGDEKEEQIIMNDETDQSKVIGIWSHKNGNRYRLYQEDASRGFDLELYVDNSWKKETSLLLVDGHVNCMNGGRGASFVEVDNHSISYSIRKWDGLMLKNRNGVLVDKYKYEAYLSSNSYLF